MTKRILLAAATIAAVAAAAPASAVTVIAERGTMANFGIPYSGAADKGFDFNTGDTSSNVTAIEAAGFTVRSVGDFGVRSGPSDYNWAVPTPGDNSQFVSVQSGGTLDIFTNMSSAAGYNFISVYVGSLDSYNTLAVLDTAGNVIQSYTGTELVAFANPAGSIADRDAYRLTFARDAGDMSTFGGIRIQSTTDNAAEFDNLVFAVPEPSTWALMLAGFGMVGMSMRARRRRTAVVFG